MLQKWKVNQDIENETSTSDVLTSYSKASHANKNVSSKLRDWRSIQNYVKKVKSSPTGHVGPEGSRRIKAPSFRDNGTVMVVGCQPYTPAAFTPRSIPDDRKHKKGANIKIF